ncbi:hypothetical protein CC1G_02909 [Coprinopsis cinerea okayama7|uniref:BTB domain-containing protein n=1 Tax=Coprinopsis cinerea (strain Okayama-7 / 130 / ATCC MYA-4618 / FGSC 9003) TaxID=240176 RepID=A8NRP2_COPC7|nr:hypothetical protein CC1G_02909 [Coprinopsis cinerea okayama7\|eukprot:XP_001835821.2 hypothetical protein CC1G_02909 [Coprinopsis cinerea okayama7\
MFEVAGPTVDGTLSDTPQAVPMYDNPSDLSSLIKALYDGVTSDPTDPTDFFQLAGVLRLSTKYFANRIRSQVIQLLLKTWTSTLEGHDEMVKKALAAPVVNNLTYPYVHPLHVLNLAHETNTQILKPSAYYFLSVYQLQELLEGKHPKLAVKHPSRPASTLSPADIRDYTLMYQYRITSVLDFIRGFCHRYTSNPKCGEVEVCGRQFAHLVGRLHRSWQPKTGALYFIRQVIGEARSTASICSLCRSDFVSKAEQLRLELWDHLPSVIGLPSWSELQERDLAV